MTATSSGSGLYLFSACWLAAVLVLGFGLYYVWNRLEQRGQQASRPVDEVSDQKTSDP
jgi:uncharacterized protein HemX